MIHTHIKTNILHLNLDIWISDFLDIAFKKKRAQVFFSKAVCYKVAT